MTDNHRPLRQAMSDLAEHGGSTDLYERTLRRSRQMQRRTAVTAGAAVMVAVFAIGGAVTFATANRPGPSTPVATQAPEPSGTTTPATPSTAPSTPSSSPSSSPKPTSKPPSTTPTSKRPHYPDCPSAEKLERLVDLPKDWYFVPSSVECWRTWATARPDGPNHGDGDYLFHYKAGTGWKYHSQGSAFNCEDLGITSGNPPFCGTD